MSAGESTSGVDERPAELKSPGYEIFIGALSILSILNLILMYAIDDPSLDSVVKVMNIVLSIIFLADFTYRLKTADSRSDYFFRQFGWADLLASLPFPQAKVLRLFRIVRVFRLFRKHGGKAIVSSLVKDRAGSALFTLLLLGILVLEFGSLEILHVEQYAEGANIVTASDAVWYVIVTISTVGYGDQYPVTNLGRYIGSLIIIIGVGIFGTFTGYLANMFLAPSRKSATVDSSSPRHDAIVEVDRLKGLIAAQQASIAELELLLNASG